MPEVKVVKNKKSKIKKVFDHTFSKLLTITSSSKKKIMAMSDFDSTNERDDWNQKLRAQALLNPNEVGQDFH